MLHSAPTATIEFEEFVEMMEGKMVRSFIFFKITQQHPSTHILIFCGSTFSITTIFPTEIITIAER